METNENKVVYGIVNNIPQFYHSSDLRNFFSQFVETKGFNCFHFRHRPEKQIPIKSNTANGPHNDVKTFCCVFRTTSDRLDNLIKFYNRKHWLDKNGDSIPSLCYISKVTVSQDKESEKHYVSRAEMKQIPTERENFTETDLQMLPELHPPDVMPNGNVGTPTKVFLELIQQCKLPPVIISKLGLTFPKTRTSRKYGDVPFDYGGDIVESEAQEETIKSGDGHEILSNTEISQNVNLEDSGSSQDCTHVKCSKQVQNDKPISDKKWRSDPETKRRMNEKIEETMIDKSDQSEGGNDSCEEWERHEALHDDPDNQERNEERLFEDKIELKWEKGGSGLVFYTDAQHWKEEEGDFDEQTADDWDVDMSAYYEKGAGDKDIKDFLSMRQSERWRNGTDNTDRFSLGLAKKRAKPTDNSTTDPLKIGKFEHHTKGIGRKILEKHGWQEGKGVGLTTDGMAEALDNEGQPPSVKAGLGYRGEKISRKQGKSKTAERDVIITTVYDKKEDKQKKEPLLRRHDHYTITYRDPVQFQKSESQQTQ